MKFTVIFLVVVLNHTRNALANSSNSILLGTELIGGGCDDDDDCVGDPGVSSHCVVDTGYGICTCMEKYVARMDLTNCLPICDDVGQGCIESQQCNKGKLGELGDCVDTKCQCVPDAVQDPSSKECLVKANLVGDSCKKEVQCTANLGGRYAFCNGVTCDCHPNSVAKSDKTKCLPLAGNIGDDCEETPQCSLGKPGKHSECKDSICQCAAGWVTPEGPVGKTCLEEASFEERCTDNAQCKATLGNLAECRRLNEGIEKAFCRCRNGAVPNAERTTCLPVSSGLGESCQIDDQCTQGIPGIYSFCFDGICHCTDLAVEMPGSPTCHKKAEFLEDLCEYHEQCRANLGESSECKVEFCVCSANFVVSSDKRKCIPGPVLIGQPCEDDNQCVANAECTGTGQCGCIDGYVPNGVFDRCLPVQDIIGGSCEEQVQCLHGTPGPLSDCIFQNFPGTPSVRVCNCTPEAVARPQWNQCYLKSKFVGDSCQFLEQCSVPLGFSLCSADEICVCSPEANPSSDLSKCLRKSSLGFPCVDDGQCSHISEPNSTICRSISYPEEGPMTCQCGPGYSERPGGGTCIKMATNIGDPCTIQVQCQDLPGSQCILVNNTRACHCDYDTEVVNGQGNRCLPKVFNLNDTPCRETVQCVGNNAECLSISETSLDKQCRCNENTFVESVQNPGNCVQIVKQVDQNCEEDIQCSKGIDISAECRDSRCQCKLRYQYYNGHCYFPAPLGGYCRSDEECHVGTNNFTVCSSPDIGRCECHSTAVESQGVCWEDKRVGDTCENVTQCRVTILGDVTCSELGTCECGYGQVVEADGKWCLAGAIAWLSSPALILLSLIFLIFPFV